MIVSASFVEHVFVSVTAFFVMMECALTILQTRSAENSIHQIPDGFETHTSLAAIRKAADYTGDLAQARLLLTVVGAAFALVMTYGHGLSVIASLTTTLFGPGVPAQWALVIIVLILMSLIEFPFGWYARFRVQESYGYMKEPRLSWLKRSLSETGTGLLYMMPATAVLLTVCEWFGNYWWGLIWLLWVGYLFWRWYLTRAESIFWHRRSRSYQNQAVKDYLKAHLKHCGYDMTDIVVMTRPRHWMRSNVVVAGRGRQVTVIVFAHALNELTARELLAAVLHEVGHLSQHHSECRIALFALLGLAAASLVGIASRDPAFFEGFGFSPLFLEMTSGSHAGFTLALCILTFPIFFYPLQPLSNLLARTMQYQADRFAARTLGPDAVIEMILRLHKDKSQTLFPSRLYTLFHYERPRPGMRVAKLQHFKKEWIATGAKPVPPLWNGPNIGLNRLGAYSNEPDKKKDTPDGQKASSLTQSFE